MGLMLWAVYLVQYLLGLQWGALSTWQTGLAYRLSTGGLLLLFLGFQWFLAFCRSRSWARLAKGVYSWHQRAGVMAPVVLFLHSTQLGFGYIFLLGSVYLGNAALGLLSPQTFQVLRKHHTPWLASHIALSILLVALVAYHAWVALYFE